MTISPFIRQSVVIGEYSIRDIVIDNKKTEDIWNIKTDKLRILFCGTYPIGTTNGYSKITYYTSKFLGKYEDEIDLSIGGFQNYKQTSGAIRTEIPNNVKIIDPLQLEKDNNVDISDLNIMFKELFSTELFSEITFNFLNKFILS